MKRFKWYRKLLGGTWYKHEFTPYALGISLNFYGTWWARYGNLNRYSNVIEIENYEQERLEKMKPLSGKPLEILIKLFIKTGKSKPTLPNRL